MTNLPLSGLSVLVTRSSNQSESLSSKLRSFGAEVIESPLIRIEPPNDWQPLDLALATLENFDWIVFTSGNAVEFAFKRLSEQASEVPKKTRIAAVGKATVTRVEELGHAVAFHPEKYDADSLVAGLAGKHDLAGSRMLVLCGELAGAKVPDRLVELGASVTTATVYRTVLTGSLPTETLELLQRQALQAITFTSSSAVTSFMRAVEDLPASCLAGMTVACIGPVTAKTAQESGLVVDVVPAEATINALADALAARFE